MVDAEVLRLRLRELDYLEVDPARIWESLEELDDLVALAERLARLLP